MSGSRFVWDLRLCPRTCNAVRNTLHGYVSQHQPPEEGRVPYDPAAARQQLISRHYELATGHQIFFGNTAYMLGFLSSFKRCSSCGKVTHGWPGQRLLARFSFHGLASKNLMRRSLRNKNGKMSYSRMTGDPEVRKKGKYAASYLLSGC